MSGASAMNNEPEEAEPTRFTTPGRHVIQARAHTVQESHEMTNKHSFHGFPPAQGLYRPENEHDGCGIGFIASIEGRKSHEIVMKGIQILVNLTHRGACGCDPETGAGAGIL